MAIPNIKRLEEAIAEALGRSKRRNFKQSVELIVVLRGLNLKDPSSKIRETTFLPNPISKRVKICVVADGETAIKAKEAGVDTLVFDKNGFNGSGGKNSRSTTWAKRQDSCSCPTERRYSIVDREIQICSTIKN